MIPAIFLLFWIVISIIAYQKNGDYDAPPGMLYMQDKAELEEKERSFLLQQEKDSQGEASYFFGSTQAGSANESMRLMANDYDY